MALVYTAAELSALKAAIITIATRGTAEVTINGRTVKFLRLSQLQDFIDIVEAEVNGATYGGWMPVAFPGVED